MEQNPYEAPKQATDAIGKAKPGGIRLMTIAVFAMLALLAVACLVLGIIASWLSAVR